MRRARERIRGRNSKINCRTVSAAAGTPSASGATSRRHASQRQVISGRMVRDDLFGGDVRRRVLKASGASMANGDGLRPGTATPSAGASVNASARRQCSAGLLEL